MTDNDGWGQPTAVFGGGSGATRHAARPFSPPSDRTSVRPQPRRQTAANEASPWDAPAAGDADWGPARTSAAPAAPPAPQPAPSRAKQRDDRELQRSIAALRAHPVRERGLPWWAALLVLAAIAAIGGYIDTSGGALQIQGGFNIGIVVASLLAILIVKRSHMFPVVIAPPIVYTFAAVFSLYLHGGLSNRGAVIDAASNYLVYGFPAIAAASACVLIVGGIRLIIRK